MIRKTVQRDAIKEAFLNKNRPIKINDILEEGKRKVESLNLATVYRNVKNLVENGWLKVINHPELGVFYEMTEKEHHYHFHCNTCDRLFKVPGCVLNEKRSVPPGFVTERHEIFLFGTCPSCSGNL
jgi:Fur family ferric uptake transcriptional regulator